MGKLGTWVWPLTAVGDGIDTLGVCVRNRGRDADVLIATLDAQLGVRGEGVFPTFDKHLLELSPGWEVNIRSDVCGEHPMWDGSSQR